MRRVIIGLIGGTILVIGIAMVVLPGPAIVVIPLGSAVLATEYSWARRWLKKMRAGPAGAEQGFVQAIKRADTTSQITGRTFGVKR